MPDEQSLGTPSGERPRFFGATGADREGGEEWERRFVALQAGRQVRITDTQFQTGKASGKNDAIDRFLKKHA